MAMLADHHTAQNPRKYHSAFDFVRGTVIELRDAWQRRRNAELIEGLSPELRKDIGWPTSDIQSDDEKAHHH